MAPAQPILSLALVTYTLRRYWARWLLPTVVLGLLAGTYAAVRRDWYETTQALMLRNEVSTSKEGPGKFHHDDEMKLSQETILELAGSEPVLRASLESVGPPAGSAPENWPSAEAIDQLRTVVQIVPPKGAEFGKTEIFYLKLKDHERGRARALVEAISGQLQVAWRQLRDAQSAAMERELTHAEAQAQVKLEDATARLTRMEQEMAGDLAELRMLHQSPAGDSDLHRTTTEVQHELLTARTAAITNRQMVEMLSAARQDAHVLLAAPAALLESQPQLERLKAGLIEAQLKTSSLRGSMTPQHPAVVSAEQAEHAIRRNIFDELEVSLRGVEANGQVIAARIAALEGSQSEIHGRHGRLATARITYTNLVNEVDTERTRLQDVQRKLIEVRMRESATAADSSTISRVNQPIVAAKPLPPSRALIVLAGLLGGGFCGLGLVLLTAPLGPPPVAPAYTSASDPRTPVRRRRVVMAAGSVLADRPGMPERGVLAERSVSADRRTVKDGHAHSAGSSVH